MREVCLRKQQGKEILKTQKIIKRLILIPCLKIKLNRNIKIEENLNYIQIVHQTFLAPYFCVYLEHCVHDVTDTFLTKFFLLINREKLYWNV